MTHAIHAAISKAMNDIARTGIAKTHQASLGGAGVNYRGIEDAMNEMCGVLIRNGITVTPRYSDLQIMERVKGDAKDGKATRFAVVRGAFTFTAVADGSAVTCEHYGEAMDSGDKAVTKAQSVAFRTALFQQFVIPTMAIDPEAGGDGESSQALSEAAIIGYANDLRAAATLDVLRDAWNVASQAAQAADDAEALKELRAIKDARKAELTK
jgi:hypothetical protein